MKRLDYKLIEALDSVVRFGGFERAAEKLCITQSAVSQRIKQLEQMMAKPLLVRSQPPGLTEAGQQVMSLYRRVVILEQDLLDSIHHQDSGRFSPVTLAVNADSVATWLLPALAPLLKQEKIELHLLVNDEARALENMRRGEATAAISLQSQPLPGCQADYLGEMRYLCVCSADFAQRYFPKGVNREALLKAPALTFGPLDDMHRDFLQQHFNLPNSSAPCHVVPSSEAFVKMAKAGLAYCMVCEVQIKDALEEGQLINLLPHLWDTRSLYWHHWVLETGRLKALSDRVIKKGRELLYRPY
ncbi:LysR family transcriptional regulator ArgP [Candidatus Sororendozoicomonas aggregata]|uniref:LysR family transcriptional regulator ArgP n=1 Tax=Candidatus Sororendozoicomonas aggregata TaxID=3073239 RepID=UPI002ED1119F